MSVVFKQFCCFYVQVSQNMCQQNGSSQNVASKIVAKVTRKDSKIVLQSWIKQLLSRLKSMRFFWEDIGQFWITSYMEQWFSLYKVLTKVLLHVARYSKFQYKILRQSFSQVASLFSNSCNFLNTCLHLSGSQVTTKIE